MHSARRSLRRHSTTKYCDQSTLGERTSAPPHASTCFESKLPLNHAASR